MYQGGVYREQGSGALRVPSGKAADWPGWLVDRPALAAAGDSTAGAVLAWPNPVAGPILVFRPILYVGTPAAGAATADIGVAADGETSGDDLFDGVDIGSATGLFEAGVGTNGEVMQTLAQGEFITATASADATGLVGRLVIPWLPL